MNAGKELDLNDNAQILAIKSPRNRLGGPYVVVTKNVHDRWAIVALRWDNESNGLGIRWFHGSVGNPFSRKPTWLIIPSNLHEGVINLLRKEGNRNALRSFLRDNNRNAYIALQEIFESEELTK